MGLDTNEFTHGLSGHSPQIPHDGEKKCPSNWTELIELIWIARFGLTKKRPRPNKVSRLSISVYIYLISSFAIYILPSPSSK